MNSGGTRLSSDELNVTVHPFDASRSMETVIQVLHGMLGHRRNRRLARRYLPPLLDADGRMFRSNGNHPLRDGGIEWVFFFRRSEVPPHELAIVARAKREKFLRLAVTFGSTDSAYREYRSTTAVHLWQMDSLPTNISWRDVFVHVFTHEPLHHAIGLSLAEIAEWGDQEWVIDKLGDGRWW